MPKTILTQNLWQGPDYSILSGILVFWKMNPICMKIILVFKFLPNSKDLEQVTLSATMAFWFCLNCSDEESNSSNEKKKKQQCLTEKDISTKFLNLRMK